MLVPMLIFFVTDLQEQVVILAKHLFTPGSVSDKLRHGIQVRILVLVVFLDSFVFIHLVYEFTVIEENNSNLRFVIFIY